MKIERLELKAFGPFTDRVLDFASDLPGLHIVHGRNEAGKSSSLRALQALLFGFPHRTSDDFLHPYSQLVVGGRLHGADGRKLVFYRRKRNKNDLFDAQDNPLPAEALAPFLHGLSAELFAAMHGINHEALVRGGQVGAVRHVNVKQGETEHVQIPVFNGADPPLVHRDQNAALGTGLADMPALDVAGKNNPRITRQNLALVDMAQGPVVVPVPAQGRQGAGSIGFVAGASAQAGVQKTDVEQARNRVGIAPTQILGHGPGGEALAMDGHAQVVQDTGRGPSG